MQPYYTLLKLLIISLALISTSLVSSQEIRVIDNKGTIQFVNNNNVTSGTAPASPVEGDVWFDNTIPTNILTKIYNGVAWVEVPTTNTQTVYTGSFIINAPSGTVTTNFTQAITSLPFKPSQITFVAYPNIEDLNIDASNSAGSNSNTLQNSYGTMNGFVRNDNGAPPYVQSVIFIGGNGNSINDISRYSSNTHCIGLRYTNKDGKDLGKIRASTIMLNTNGFTLSIDYILGTVGNAAQRDDILDESLVVLFTAYK